MTTHAPHCKKPKWKFKQTKTGIKRTCKCGYAVTQVANGVFGDPAKPVSKKNKYVRKKQKRNGKQHINELGQAPIFTPRTLDQRHPPVLEDSTPQPGSV